MPELRDFQAVYEAYIAEVEQAERNRKPGEGIFGLKGGPKDDPCHDRFIGAMRDLLQVFALEQHPPAEVRDLLSFIYTAPLAHKGSNLIYWMLMAVHGLPLELIEQLAPADAGDLYRRYNRDYPRWERMPVQKQTLDALKRRAG